MVEIHGWDQLAVHDDVAQVVDQWLRGYPIAPEMRSVDEHGQVRISQEQTRASEASPGAWKPEGKRTTRRNYLPEAEAETGIAGDGATKAAEVRVFLFGVGRDKLEAAVAESRIPVEIVNELRRADMVLTTKTHYRRGSQLVRIAESSGKPVCVLRKNSMPQLQEFLRTVIAEWGRKGGAVGRASPGTSNVNEYGPGHGGSRGGRKPGVERRVHGEAYAAASLHTTPPTPLG